MGLARLGVGRNDVVSMQLPNWWQFSLMYLACSRIGAVLNPLMHIFRERELSFMLKHGESKVLIVPKLFRGFDHEAMARALQPSLPHLQRIVVVGAGEGGSDDFDALLTTPEWEKAPDAREILTRHRPGPDDITQLIYTSGTTGEPKGVMHSANTVMANIVPYAERLKLDAGRRGADGLADGAPDRLHVRADDADHAARQRGAARRLGARRRPSS